MGSRLRAWHRVNKLGEWTNACPQWEHCKIAITQARSREAQKELDAGVKPADLTVTKDVKAWLETTKFHYVEVWLTHTYQRAALVVVGDVPMYLKDRALRAKSGKQCRHEFS